MAKLGAPLMTIRQVAEHLGFSYIVVWNWVDAGEIPYIIVGKSKRVRPEDLADWINAKTVYGRAVPGGKAEEAQ